MPRLPTEATRLYLGHEIIASYSLRGGPARQTWRTRLCWHLPPSFLPPPHPPPSPRSVSRPLPIPTTLRLAPRRRAPTATATAATSTRETTTAAHNRPTTSPRPQRPLGRRPSSSTSIREPSRGRSRPPSTVCETPRAACHVIASASGKASPHPVSRPSLPTTSPVNRCRPRRRFASRTRPTPRHVTVDTAVDKTREPRAWPSPTQPTQPRPIALEPPPAHLIASRSPPAHATSPLHTPPTNPHICDHPRSPREPERSNTPPPSATSQHTPAQHDPHPRRRQPAPRHHPTQQPPHPRSPATPPSYGHLQAHPSLCDAQSPPCASKNDAAGLNDDGDTARTRTPSRERGNEERGP
ncbi:hypothetical protein GALMADRAFT_141570 [Galerina marginata CBS 339.88]|uniref:Uncharacterized protein n=1 Tax=Galerina marginata (strain CBS 339.88) TaxID=685588 RepID=A0A067T6B9_GALM3|nr:hypothetical protein GALMADRAFT_141570 [Galerina marginata CBS 339.88]